MIYIHIIILARGTRSETQTIVGLFCLNSRSLFLLNVARGSRSETQVLCVSKHLEICSKIAANKTLNPKP